MLQQLLVLQLVRVFVHQKNVEVPEALVLVLEALALLLEASPALLSHPAPSFACACAFFDPENKPRTTVTGSGTGSAELGFISRRSASKAGKAASASVAFLIAIFVNFFAAGFFACSTCGRGASDI